MAALACLWALLAQEPRRRAAVWVVVFLGVVILGIGVYDLVTVENSVDESEAPELLRGADDLVSAGWGLWLVVVGGGILGLASFDFARRSSARELEDVLTKPETESRPCEVDDRRGVLVCRQGVTVRLATR